jgi:hypothetical protein
MVFPFILHRMEFNISVSDTVISTYMTRNYIHSRLNIRSKLSRGIMVCKIIYTGIYMYMPYTIFILCIELNLVPYVPSRPKVRLVTN